MVTFPHPDVALEQNIEHNEDDDEKIYKIKVENYTLNYKVSELIYILVIGV